MVFNTKEIFPEDVPEKSESESTPEPDGLELLTNIASSNQAGLLATDSRVDIPENFVDDRFRQARKLRLEEEALIIRLISLDPDELDPEVKIDFNLSEEEILKFIQTQNLTSQPTDLLLKLADRLKERRERHSLG